MKGIFLSYRREDSQGQAGRLYDDLVKAFGKDRVFMDVAGIEPGRDFRRVIDDKLATCGVVLVLIGKNWIDSKDPAGKARLQEEDDFVRMEASSALKRDIPVIPVLVGGAAMPSESSLPSDLRSLVYRNNLELTHARWESDVNFLVNSLRHHVDGAATNPLDPRWSKILRILPVSALLPAVIWSGGYLKGELAKMEGLSGMLLSRDWRGADKESWRLLKENVGSQSGKPMSLQGIGKISCFQLMTIDDRWKSNSNNRFGFSVQRDVWKQTTGYQDDNSFLLLGDKLGWKKDNRWVPYGEFLFSLNSNTPTGNLPSRGVGPFWAEWGVDRERALVKRLESCSGIWSPIVFISRFLMK